MKTPYLLFNYSDLTIPKIQIVFGSQKMNEYEYQIPLFGPNYSNIRIIRIIRSNTGLHTSKEKRINLSYNSDGFFAHYSSDV